MTTVVHVVGALSFGGAETSLLGQVKRSREFGVKTLVFSISGRYGDLEEEYRSAGAQLFTSPLRRRPLRTIVRFVRLCRTSRVDVVVSHIGLPTAFFLLLGRIANVRRRVAVLHSEGDCKATSRLKALQNEFLRNLMILCSSVNIGVSEPALKYGDPRWLPWRMKARAVISNGVDTDRFRPSAQPGDSRQVIYVGRSSPVKNRQRLAGISRSLVERGWKRIVVVGPVGEDVVTADEALILLGPRTDVPELLRDSAALVLVSEEEGEGIVILEALASGIPVVSSPTGGAASIASRTAGVDLLSLNESDGIWADRLIRAAQKHANGETGLIAQGVIDNGYAVSAVMGKWYETYIGPNSSIADS